MAPSLGNSRPFWLCLGLIIALLSFQGCTRKPVVVFLPATPQESIAQIDEKADPIEVLAALTDYEKLRTLKPEARSANGRFDKIFYWLFVAEQKKIPPAVAISKGSFTGQIVEVDHIVPVSCYPQFANELANLQLMPAMQNRAKGNKMGASEFEKLKELQALTPPPVIQN